MLLVAIKPEAQIASKRERRRLAHFDAVIGAAEDQECKEAFLAYYFLHVAVERPTQAMLERRIEAWLKETFGVDVEFAVDKALAKLGKLGVLTRMGDRLAVPALARRWGSSTACGATSSASPRPDCALVKTKDRVYDRRWGRP